MSQISVLIWSVRLGRLAGMFCILMGLSQPAAVGAATSDAPGADVQNSDAYGTDRIVVHYRNRTTTARTISTPAVAANLVHDASNVRGYIAKQLHTTGLGSQIWKMDKRMTLAEATTLANDIVAKDPDVEYAEPDRIAFPQMAPNDSYFATGSQWALSQSLAGINVQSAWDRTTGSGVVVAVLDTGYRPHVDLAANIVPGYDFVSNLWAANDGNGRDASPLDPGDNVAAGECARFPNGASSSWHGTHVAGTIAAVTNNGIGVAGVAFGAKVQPVRVLGKCGGSISDIADGILWASGASLPGVPANPTPARVINLSLWGQGACGPTYAAAINVARSRGAVVITIAGNGNGASNVGVNAANTAPANCPGVITVAAIDTTGARASFSNWGNTVALAAPGVNIYSTFNNGASGPVSDNYDTRGGTSMAAPHVSGVAALMLSANPALRVDDVAWKIINSTRAFPVACAGCGAGLLDASNAVNSVVGYSPTPVPLFTVTRLSDDLITATWRITNTRNSPVQLTDLYLNIWGVIVRYGQVVGMGPTFLSTTCVPGSWIGPGGTCNVSTNDGELCGGTSSYVLSATNSTGVGVASESAFVNNASCGS
jgi:serine protease